MRFYLKRALLVTILLYPALVFSAVCNLQSEVTPLQLVSPEVSQFKNPVLVQWRLQDKILWVDFDVQVPVQSQKKVLTPNKDYPFQYDVVEVFLAVGDPAAKDFEYFEFEVTPNNQSYDVKITVSGYKKKFEDKISLGSEVRGVATAKNWSGSFKIPLENLNWNGNISWLRGNFYAIIGKKPHKTYWSTFLPKQAKVNFHAPEHFKPLFDCE